MSAAILDLRPNDQRQTDALATAVLQAEHAFLGCALYDREAVDSGDGLDPEHFLEPTHGRIWETIRGFARLGRYGDPISVWNRMETDEGLVSLGGPRFLADLVDACPPVSRAQTYASEIIDHARRRRVIEIAERAQQALKAGEGTGETIEAIEGELLALSHSTKGRGGFKSLAPCLALSMQSAAAAYERGGGISGLTTGLADLDRRLGGLHPSDLIIIAARPSMGKTGLATNIAMNAAKADAKVGFFSLEMSAEQLGTRLLADAAMIEADRIRRGDFRPDEYAKLRDAEELIRDRPIHIEETGGISISRLCAAARRLKRTSGLDLLIVDYLQLVTTERGRNDNRVQEVTAITMALKALAKELAVPVIALSQLSRKVEERDDKRPQLSDLRESGSIEQDADVVLFIYREAYYLARSEPSEPGPKLDAWKDKMDAARWQADIIIGKQRHGPIGSVRLHYNEDLVRFSNLARPDHGSPYHHGDAR